MPEFKTLTDVYQECFTNSNVESLNESYGKGVVRFTIQANIQLFINEIDIKAHSRYDEIIQSSLSEHEKSAAIEELLISIIKDRISEINVEKNVDIKPEALSIKNADYFRTSPEDLIAKIED